VGYRRPQLFTTTGDSSMQRDCGKGRLIPHSYLILYCVGMDDTEQKETVSGPYSSRFDEILATLPPFSNIRLYVRDKQGWANCLYSVTLSSTGEQSTSPDRRGEL